MERGEAQRSPLVLLGPDALDVARWTRDGASGADLWTPVLQRAMQLCEVSPGPLALAGSLSAGVVEATCLGLGKWGWSFVPGESISARLRKRKSDDVLAGIRRAADGVCEAFRAVARMLACASVSPTGELRQESEPLTVGRLRSEIAVTLARCGLSQPERGIVAPAEEGGVPHSLGTDERILRAGESLVVDLFPKGHAFADCTRTFCVGEPPPALRDAHALVREAVRVAERTVDRRNPGVRGFDVQLAVCEYFQHHGWPTSQHERGTERGYVHGLGHGVGVELHELPSFREHAPDAEGRLEPGDVITLEPGLYEPEPADGSTGWGVRLEDTYVVSEGGLENLTPLPRDLDPQVWFS